MVGVQGDNVLIHVLDHHQVLIALDIQFEHGVGAVVTQQRVNIDTGSRKVNGGVQERRIDNTRNLPGGAQTAGKTLTKLGARLGGNNDFVAHITTPLHNVKISDMSTEGEYDRVDNGSQRPSPRRSNATTRKN